MADTNKTGAGQTRAGQTGAGQTRQMGNGNIAHIWSIQNEKNGINILNIYRLCQKLQL